MRYAQNPRHHRAYRSKSNVDRVVRRSRWWWLRLLIGIGLLCLTILLGGPVLLRLIYGVLGALLVLSGLMELYIHVKHPAAKRDRPR